MSITRQAASASRTGAGQAGATRGVECGIPALASWEALGTSVVLVVGDEHALDEARAIVGRELERIDWACSRFRADSELSRANARAGRYVPVDELLIEALEVALRAARLTDGDVDPTVGTALEIAGYDRDWKLLEQAPASACEPLGTCEPSRPGGPARACEPDEPALRIRATARPGWQAIEIDHAAGAVRVPSAVKLDLGSTAKAWAADRAARAVHQASGLGALVSLGGDISTSGPAPQGGWRVHVTDDHRAGSGAFGQRITIRDGGLATSSVAVRRWRHGGRAMHHIIDPRSGAPARGPWRTVSVAAIDCVDANIASTAALVRGEDASQWLASLGVPARLVSHDGDVLTLGAWPAERPRVSI